MYKRLSGPHYRGFVSTTKALTDGYSSESWKEDICYLELLVPLQVITNSSVVGLNTIEIPVFGLWHLNN
jgi:hypothetical protein